MGSEMCIRDRLGAVPEQELLDLVRAMSSTEPVQLLEATRNLLNRGRDPGAVLQGLAGILRDLVLMAAAPDRPELTGVSPQFREQLPDLAKTIGRTRLLRWQADLRGSEQQLRQSVQPRLWLEVLLLGLLAEPIDTATTTVVAPATTPPRPAPVNAAKPPAPEAGTPKPSPETPTATTAPAKPEAPSTPVAAEEPAPPSPELPNLSSSEANLPELWQQILGSLELPSTRMLLSQQAQLVRIDANRAIVQVAGNWMGMVQSRASLLEQAVAKALGGNRQLVLEASSGAVPPSPVVSPPTPKPITPPTIPPIAPPPTTAATTSPTKPEPSAEADPAAPPAPVAAAVASPKPAVSAELPQREQPSSLPADPKAKPEPQAPPAVSADIDRHAKTLANFFNGEVLAVDDIRTGTNAQQSEAENPEQL